MPKKTSKTNTKKTLEKKTNTKNLFNDDSIFNEAYLNFSFSKKKSHCKIIRSNDFTKVVFTNLYPYYNNYEYLPATFAKNVKFNLSLDAELDDKSLKNYQKQKSVGYYFFYEDEKEKVLDIEGYYNLTNLNNLISSIEINGNEYLESLIFGTTGSKDTLKQGKTSKLKKFSVIFQTEEEDPFSENE